MRREHKDCTKENKNTSWDNLMIIGLKKMSKTRKHKDMASVEESKDKDLIYQKTCLLGAKAE